MTNRGRIPWLLKGFVSGRWMLCMATGLVSVQPSHSFACTSHLTQMKSTYMPRYTSGHITPGRYSFAFISLNIDNVTEESREISPH